MNVDDIYIYNSRENSFELISDFFAIVSQKERNTIILRLGQSFQSTVWPEADSGSTFQDF